MRRIKSESLPSIKEREAFPMEAEMKKRVIAIMFAAIMMISACGMQEDKEQETLQSSTEESDSSPQEGEKQNTGEAENVSSTEVISDEQVQISLKEFLTSPTVAGMNWMDCKLIDIMDFYGVNADNTFADLTYCPDETTYEEESVEYIPNDSFPEECVYHNIGMMDSKVVYCAMHAGESDEIGSVCYFVYCEDDPEKSGYISDRLRKNMEMFSGYLMTNECESVEDLLAVWGMEEVDSSMMEAARNHQSYTGTYTTEYGNLNFVLEYSETPFSDYLSGKEKWNVWLQPQLKLTIDFDQTSTPFQKLTIITRYEDFAQVVTEENQTVEPYTGSYEPVTLEISVTKSGYVQ